MYKVVFVELHSITLDCMFFNKIAYRFKLKNNNYF